MPALVPILLREAIGDCLDRFHGLALQKGVVLAAPVVDETLAVLGDEELLGKVLDNLVSNAVRYAKTSVAVVVTEENRHIQIVRSLKKTVDLSITSTIFISIFSGFQPKKRL